MTSHANSSVLTSSHPERASGGSTKANSSYETFKHGRKAIDEAAEKTWQQAAGV